MVRSITRGYFSLLFLRTLFITAAAAMLIAGPTKSPYAQDTTVDLSGGLPAWRHGHSVTTSTADILPAITDLAGLETAVPLPIPGDWKIPPGYYRSTICSYCMDLGRHAPNRGDSVCIAPILGDRAPLIRNVLARAQQNPSIMQKDIQNLIWSVADGTPLGWNDTGLLDRVAPLLTPAELAIINMPHSTQPDADQLRSMQERSVMNFEQLRTAAFNGINGRGGADPRLSAAYAQLRKVGITSPDLYNAVEQRINQRFFEAAQSANVPRGIWSYVGNGFYLRAFVNTYSSTVLEVLKVAPATVTRDDLDRITRFESGGYMIEAEYEDMPAVQKVDGKPVSVWNFKSIVYSDPGGKTVTIENKGFVVPEPDASPKTSASPSPTRTRDPLSVGLFHDALSAVSNPALLKRPDQWIVGNLNRLLALRNLSNNRAALAATSNSEILNVSNFVATSTNTNKQRLALSNVVQ